MKLEGLKNYFKDISLSHKDIKTFIIGNNVDVTSKIRNDYPAFFLELPYYVSPVKYNYDNVTVAFNILMSTVIDDVDKNHYSISRSKEIGDVIIDYINSDDNSEFKILNYNAVSISEFTDDSLSGFRYELTLMVPRETCDSTNFKAYFNV